MLPDAEVLTVIDTILKSMDLGAKYKIKEKASPTTLTTVTSKPNGTTLSLPNSWKPY
jgi:hypothetical protein